jgi:galactokinase/mevalonate kinase-like predicted kinase
VLNVTIDRFAYAFISPRDDGMVLTERRCLDLRHSCRKRSCRCTAVSTSRWFVTTISALVVTLVDAFRALLSAPLGQYDVARESNFSWLRTADTVIFARDRLPLVRSCAL